MIEYTNEFLTEKVDSLTNQLTDNTTGFLINLNDHKYGLKLDGIADDSVALQNALNIALNGQTNPLAKTVILPTHDIRITTKIEVPVGVSLVGVANARIIADYGAWQGTNYQALHIATAEGINFNGLNYAQSFENFQVIGKNNATVQSIGISFSTPSTIAFANSVNYAPILGHISKVVVSNFDTAFTIVECWNYTFRELIVLNCRVGISIVGKAVNLFFDQLNMTNFTKTYTSSVGKMYGIYFDSKFTYTDGEGRPEGIVFQNSLVYGANTNVYIYRALFVRITDCVLDGATEDCVYIVGPDNVSIKGCWIYTSGIGFSGVKLALVSTSNSKIEIFDNEIVGVTGTGTNTQYGIYSVDGARIGVVIDSNFITGFSNPMYFNYFNSAKIINNYGLTNRGTFIYCQTDCFDTIIDGNVSDDNYPILTLQPTTSKLLSIGDNKSGTSRTSYKGVVTMLTGTTSIDAPNSMYTSELYYRVVTIIQPLGNLGSTWVVPETGWSTATIHCSTAPAADTKIRYEAIAVPIAAI